MCLFESRLFSLISHPQAPKCSFLVLFSQSFEFIGRITSLRSQLGSEIRHIYLVGTVDVHSAGLNFSAPFRYFTVINMWFFARFFQFFEFVPGVTLL